MSIVSVYDRVLRDELNSIVGMQSFTDIDMGRTYEKWERMEQVDKMRVGKPLLIKSVCKVKLRKEKKYERHYSSAQ